MDVGGDEDEGGAGEAVRLAWLAFALSRLAALLVAPDSSARHFFGFARAVVQGATPYGDAPFEYPPLALVPLLWPAWLTDDVGMYTFLVASEVVLADVVVVLGALRLARALRGARGGRADAGVVALYAALPWLTGTVPWLRFDTFVALALVWALVFVVERRYRWVDVVLAAGVCLKLVPVLFVPLAWAHARAAGGAGVRGIATSVLTLAGVAGLILAPALALFGAAGLWTFVGYHSERTLHLEGTLGVVAGLMARAAGVPLAVERNHGAFHTTGWPADVLTPVADGVALGLLLLATTWAVRSILRTREPGRGLDIVTVRAGVLVLLAFTVGGKVLSPQFLLWMFPLLAALVGANDTAGRRASWLIASAAFLGWLIYPTFYDRLKDQDVWVLLLAAARNLTLAAAAVWLVSTPPAAITRTLSWLTRESGRRVVYRVGWGAALALLVVLNLYPVFDADIWFHLRVGADIRAHGVVPTVDVYSATAAGRPFVAHSWLAEVLFSWLADASDRRGLTILRADLFGLIGVALYASVARERLSSVVALPLAVFAIFALTASAEMRPFLFGVTGAAVMALCLERYRQRDRWVWLLPVLPLVALWANLHGSFLLGPALLVMTSAANVLERRFGDMKQRSPLPPLAIAALAVVAAGLNPYGFGLHRFALSMLFERGYIKDWILEWFPIWDAAARAQPAYLFGIAWLLLAAGLLVAERRGRPVRDVVTLLVVGVLFARSNRFVVYLLVLTFPLVVRHATTLFARHARDQPSAGAVIAGAAAALCLVFTTVSIGAGFQQRSTARLGLGVARPLAFDPVNAAIGQGLTGTALTSYVDGSYLLYAGAPLLRPVIDPRIDVYGEALTDAYFEMARANGERTLAYVDRHDVNVAIASETESLVMVAPLLTHPDWDVVWRNGEQIVLARKRNAQR